MARVPSMAQWVACAVLAAAGCGDSAAPPAVSSGRPDARDGGPTVPGDAGPEPEPDLRPDGGAALPEADIEVEVPFGTSADALLLLEADLGALDVHFSVDTTSSIAGEIDALQEDLEQTILPGLQARVEDAAYGLSRFEDFPDKPYGTAGSLTVRADRPFELLSPVTKQAGRVVRAFDDLDMPLGFGGDRQESSAEALWQIATGEGYTTGGKCYIGAFDDNLQDAAGNLGGVGFRPGALHVVLHITDAPSHEPDDYKPKFPGLHDLEEAAEALGEVQARVISIVSKTCVDDGEPAGPDAAVCDDLGQYVEARAQFETLAHRTGAERPLGDGTGCPTGIDGDEVPPYEPEEGDPTCPLVFDVRNDGTGLTETVVDAIVELVNGIRFTRIHAETGIDPIGFVQRVTPVIVEQEDGGDPPVLDDLLPEDAPDGENDSFVEVRARATLGFNVRLKNTAIAPTDRAQQFRVLVRVLGDGLIVDEQTLRIVVPPTSGPAPDDDGGM